MTCFHRYPNLLKQDKRLFHQTQNKMRRSEYIYMIHQARGHLQQEYMMFSPIMPLRMQTEQIIHPRFNDAKEPPKLCLVDAECPVELVFRICANCLAVVWFAAHKAPLFKQWRRENPCLQNLSRRCTICRSSDGCRLHCFIN